MNIAQIWKALKDDPIFSQIIEVMKSEEFHPAPEETIDEGSETVVGEMSSFQKALFTLAHRNNGQNQQLVESLAGLMWQSIRQSISGDELSIKDRYVIVEVYRR